jgi:hypothetical protein
MMEAEAKEGLIQVNFPREPKSRRVFKERGKILAIAFRSSK